MRVDIRNQHLQLDQGMQSSIERRLRFLLGRFGERISRVTVYLSDLNGPHGGLGKHCRIVVRLVRSGQIVVEDTDTDLGAVVERTADRVGKTVRRELERRRDRMAPLAPECQDLEQGG